jgi:hypothetical protein
VEPEVLISVLKDLHIDRCSILSIGGDVSGDAFVANDQEAKLWTEMGEDGEDG